MKPCTTQLLIRPVANGFIVEPFDPSSVMTPPDNTRHVFGRPSTLGDYVQEFYDEEARVRNAASDLRAALGDD